MKISCGEEVAMENAPSYIALAVVKFEVKKDWKVFYYLSRIFYSESCSRRPWIIVVVVGFFQKNDETNFF